VSFTEVQGGSQSHPSGSTDVLVHSVVPEGVDKGGSVGFSLGAESEACSHSSDFRDPLGEFFGDVIKTTSELTSGLNNVLLQVIAFDQLVLV